MIAREAVVPGDGLPVDVGEDGVRPVVEQRADGEPPREQVLRGELLVAEPALLVVLEALAYRVRGAARAAVAAAPPALAPEARR